MSAITLDYPALEAQYGAGVYNQRGITLVRGAGATVWDDQG